MLMVGFYSYQRRPKSGTKLHALCRILSGHYTPARAPGQVETGRSSMFKMFKLNWRKWSMYKQEKLVVHVKKILEIIAMLGLKRRQTELVVEI